MAINLFDLDVTGGEADPKIDGEAFIRRRASPAVRLQLAEAQRAYAEAQRKVLLPLGLELLKSAAMLGALVVAAALLRAAAPLEQAVRNAGGFLVFGGVCLVTWLALLLAGALKKRAGLRDQGELPRILDAAVAAARRDLETPGDATLVDVLQRVYQVKNGKRRAACRTEFINTPMWCYLRDGCLCLAAPEFEAAVPLTLVQGLYRVDRRIAIPQWNKEKPTNDPAFKPYEIRPRAGMLYIKPYYAVRVRSDGQDYEILIPNYERGAVEKVVAFSTAGAYNGDNLFE